MQIKFDFNKDKILLCIERLKQKLYTSGGRFLAWLKVKTVTVKPLFVEHKETIFKVSAPLLIIFAGLYSCSVMQRNITKNLSELFEIADNIREHYLGKPDYWGLYTDFAAKQHLVDAKFIKDNKIILNSGTEVFIGEGEKAEVLMPFSQNFDISIRGLNKAECIAYSEAKFSEERLLEIMRISIVNKTGNYIFEWGGIHPLPIQKYATKDFCQDSDNTLIWSIK
ncbi:MAG: hypothetical protein J6C85_05005 [Alphaproteobacteria bacterium]|nr:hypothetical protein [Alphaproteobacteria bacterium]